MEKLTQAWRGLALAAVVGLLAGCAGTIKQDARVNGDVSRVEGVAQVVAVMSPEALKLQPGNPQFSRDELANFLRRRLESKGLVAPAATHRVEVLVTDIRVRSGVAAIMLGFLAGEDRVTAKVRVLDPNGRALRSFEVKTTYAFGGLAGGQDGMRMNWIYDKFSEMASVELEKVVAKPGAALAAAPAPAPAAVPVASVPAAVASPAGTAAPATAITPVAAVSRPTRTAVAGAAAITDVEAVPVNDKGKDVYRDWLTRRNPRAFVVSEGGRWNATWTNTPKDPADPKDPAERAMKHCQNLGRVGCTLYAVDNNVVWVKPASPVAQTQVTQP